jgi:hypothetical protein
MLLRQSTAAVISFGPFVDPTDGVTLVTGLVSALDNGSTGIMLSKTGGALAIRHATVTATTYDAYGCYRVTLDATDTGTLGRLRMIFAAAANCLPVWMDLEVVPADIYDALVAGSAALKIASPLKLNTALPNYAFVMVDSSGIPRTGLTVAAQRSIDGAAFAACANSVSEVGSGLYLITLAAADLNGAVITLRFTSTGAQDRLITLLPMP